MEVTSGTHTYLGCGLLSHVTSNHMQEEAERDPDMIVLWTAKEWANWPRGLSKAAARVLMDPIVMYSVMGPVMACPPGAHPP
jgi:hypothetical protein